ncbi:MAG: hypothetical protein CME60_09895 [Halobacteriovoraceae bacterium]|nr:hypothetical protein [Halobacteriovoraceae bacterium]
MTKKIEASIPCFGHNANEETAGFNKRNSWNREDTLDEKYLEFLAPHSRKYFSRLRPIFSFEIKSLTSLNAFSHVLLRDGVLHLLKFFQRFPSPKGLISKIIIDEEFEPLVPDSWKERIFYFKIRGKKEGPLKENLFLFLTVSKYQHTDDSIIQLNEILNSVKGNVFVTTSLNILRGEDYLDYDRSQAFRMSDSLFKGREVDFVGLHQLGGLISEYRESSSFLNFNPYKYWFSDSFVNHYYLNQGISNIEIPDKKNNESMNIDLGPYHSMSIHRGGKHINAELKKLLFDDFQFPLGEFFNDQGNGDRNIDDYFKVFYTQNKFEKMAQVIAQKLYGENKENVR